jgi:prepilin-type N-terminal cleavage/methylation domain-containing protein
MEPYTYSRGFTLTELLAVFAIISTLSMVVLSSQSHFNKSLLLTNTAYDIALTLRATQTFGLGSRVLGGVGSQNAGHGVHFSSASATAFVQFIDVLPVVEDGASPDVKPGDGVYEVSEQVTTHNLQNGIIIQNMCALALPQNQWRCITGTPSSINSIDIVFSRPNADPSIRRDGSKVQEASEACITIASPQGGERSILVTASGQMRVEKESCEL